MLALGVVAGFQQDNVAHAATKHCVANADTGTQTCYGSFREAISAASGGKVTTDPSDPAYNVQRNAYNSAVAIASDPLAGSNVVFPGGGGEVVVGVQFDGPNYTGNSITSLSDRLCSSKSHDIGTPIKVRGGNGFLFGIGSLQTWGRCWLWIGDFDGAREGPYKTDTPDLGAATDRYLFAYPRNWPF
ncbi:hypothetical protein [Williamsia sp. CHRR-6]|uniref:hypothetical protein n=1 Tax=Williamsia sp. CHRR-6 TaxID=2835871 RepID=UPI001BDA6293|nr:hypothetical protein [Williamsia sp. CHRR-6]MBT0566997.1 hypothetical protein [Williamsia sp. CHRR-6]